MGLNGWIRSGFMANIFGLSLCELAKRQKLSFKTKTTHKKLTVGICNRLEGPAEMSRVRRKNGYWNSKHRVELN